MWMGGNVDKGAMLNEVVGLDVAINRLSRLVGVSSCHVESFVLYLDARQGMTLSVP